MLRLCVVQCCTFPLCRFVVFFLFIFLLFPFDNAMAFHILPVPYFPIRFLWWLRLVCRCMHIRRRTLPYSFVYRMCTENQSCGKCFKNFGNKFNSVKWSNLVVIWKIAGDDGNKSRQADTYTHICTRIRNCTERNPCYVHHLCGSPKKMVQNTKGFTNWTECISEARNIYTIKRIVCKP